MPESGDVVNNLAIVYEAAGQEQRAIEYFSMALNLDEGNPEYSGNLARVLMRADQDPTQVALLLQDVVFNDTRPEWVAWARDQLNLREPIRAAAHTQATAEKPEVVEPLPVSNHIGDSELLETPELPQP